MSIEPTEASLDRGTQVGGSYQESDIYYIATDPKAFPLTECCISHWKNNTLEKPGNLMPRGISYFHRFSVFLTSFY